MLHTSNLQDQHTVGWDFMGLWLRPSLHLSETQGLGSLAAAWPWEGCGRTVPGWDLPLLTCVCIPSWDSTSKP